MAGSGGLQLGGSVAPHFNLESFLAMNESSPSATSSARDLYSFWTNKNPNQSALPRNPKDSARVKTVIYLAPPLGARKGSRSASVVFLFDDQTAEKLVPAPGFGAFLFPERTRSNGEKTHLLHPGLTEVIEYAKRGQGITRNQLRRVVAEFSRQSDDLCRDTLGDSAEKGLSARTRLPQNYTAECISFAVGASDAAGGGSVPCLEPATLRMWSEVECTQRVAELQCDCFVHYHA